MKQAASTRYARRSRVAKHECMPLHQILLKVGKLHELSSSSGNANGVALNSSNEIVAVSNATQ